jgi:hypothetical protein
MGPLLFCSRTISATFRLIIRPRPFIRSSPGLTVKVSTIAQTGHLDLDITFKACDPCLMDRRSYPTSGYNLIQVNRAALRTTRITYNSSGNLKYDAEGGTLHSNYNGRVQRMNNAIWNRLAQL